MRFRAILPLAVLAMLGSVPAHSQGLTDDELGTLFQQQRDAFAAVNSGLGQTRGLTVLPMDGTDLPADGADASIPDQPASAVVSSETVVAPVEKIGVFPEPMQINVRIRFDFDSAKLNASQTPELQQLCRVMKSSDIKLFQIIGHTDATGTPDYNQQLSLLRAEEVKRFFVNDCGMQVDRLQAVGMGERVLHDPADPNSPENRRVEFQALS